MDNVEKSPSQELTPQEIDILLRRILAAANKTSRGTIPDCTGCDHDDFIDPGAEIQITIEKLGTLRCRFAEPTGTLLPSRWPVREPLQKYHG